MWILNIKWLTQLKDCSICGLRMCQFMYVNYVLTQNHFIWNFVHQNHFIHEFVGPWPPQGQSDYIALDTTFGSFTLLKSVSSH